MRSLEAGFGQKLPALRVFPELGSQPASTVLPLASHTMIWQLVVTDRNELQDVECNYSRRVIALDDPPFRLRDKAIRVGMHGKQIHLMVGSGSTIRTRTTSCSGLILIWPIGKHPPMRVRRRLPGRL